MDAPEINSKSETPNPNTPAVNRNLAHLIFFQLFSLVVAGSVLLLIFTIHTNQIGLDYVLPTIITLTVAVLFRYVAVYRRFGNPLYRKLLLVPLFAVFCVSIVFTAEQFIDAVTVRELWRVFQTDSFGAQSSSFLPEWWSATILVPAGLLILIGSSASRDLVPYQKPTGIRTVAISPVYFGVSCVIFGLWAVLFVGISIQRVIVIAPIFEELLKFGTALLIGSVLFDRSLLARIGVAAVVGSLFGHVEHATTYPAEPDYLYLFRTLFHMMTTVLSISAYTRFEPGDENRLLLLAPALSILIHFFYNTFAVVSNLITLVVFGYSIPFLTPVYGIIAILVLTGLVTLVLLRHRTFRLLYMPLETLLFNSGRR